MKYNGTTILQIDNKAKLDDIYLGTAQIFHIKTDREIEIVEFVSSDPTIVLGSYKYNQF